MRSSATPQTQPPLHATSGTRPSASPRPSLDADAAAVHLYDLDTVFLSKTVVSLADVFAHAVDDIFDMSPLPTRVAAPSPPTATAAPGALPTEPHSTNTGISMTCLPFSGGSAHYTSVSLKAAARRAAARAATLRPRHVMRGADGTWRATASPTAATTAGAAAQSWRMRQLAHEQRQQQRTAPPRVLVVPIDSYHSLLSFRDVDVTADGPSTAAAVASCGVDGGGADHKVSNGAHAAVPRVAVAVGRLSAAAPGLRPARCGIAVVQRVEGELRSDAQSQGAASGAPPPPPPTYPTRSRVAQGLPLPAFDGWVRDYTVYGVRCNEAVLRAAWEAKRRERAATTSPPPPRSSSTTPVGAKPCGAARSPPMATASTAAAEVVEVADAGTAGPTAETSASASGRTPREVDSPLGPPATHPSAVAAASPSLDRLHCSSTTTSASNSVAASSTPSSSTKRSDAEAEEGAGDGRRGQTPAAADASTKDAFDASAPLPDAHARQRVMWEEEQRRTARAAAHLRHRFLVSDAAQHAIWALEVCVPAMEVRVVAPADFYELEPSAGAALPSASESDDGESEGEVTADADAHDGTGAAPAVDMPRRVPASAVTHGRATPGARPRSPSPMNPATSPDGAASSVTAAASRSRTRRSRSSASPSLAAAEEAPAPLMGGARGFVDGHFSVARFHAPGALCWRVDAGSGDEDEEEGDAYHRWRTAHGRGDAQRPSHDPVAGLRRRRGCAVLFISDMGNSAIRYANFQTRLVRTITGVDGVPGYRDGSCVSSLLWGATALAWCSAGLLFADGANGVVRIITNIRRPSRTGADAKEEGMEETRHNADNESGAARLQPGAALKSVQEAADAGSTAAASAAPASTVIVRANGPHGGAAVDERPAASPSGTAAASPLPSSGGDAVAVADHQTGTSLASAPQQQPQRRGARNPRAAAAAATSDAPRVWTLAGCVQPPPVSTATGSGAATAAVPTYVDCAVPTRARFGFLSDMALWTDEAGDTQVLVMDQTHHAVRVVDARSGVSTYVGPLDYDMTPLDHSGQPSAAAAVRPNTADVVPAGLVSPCSLTVGALVKERSPALLGSSAVDASPADAAHAAAMMIKPQPYLYTSTPLFFTASAVTGAVSVLLPISQRSALTPWHTEAAARVEEKEAAGGGGGGGAAAADGNDDATLAATIRAALQLGVATEGLRTIGEASAPSLKRVVLGDAAEEAEALSEPQSGSDSSEGDPGAVKAGVEQRTSATTTTTSTTAEAHETRRLLRRAAVQQAAQYRRLRFPWMLPPPVPPLAKQLVAGCTCHVSGARRSTSAGRTVPGATLEHTHPQQGQDAGTVGVRSGSLRTSPPPAPLQRLLFHSPPRHPPIQQQQHHQQPLPRYPVAALTDPATTAAAREMASLLLEPASVAAAAPYVVEVAAEAAGVADPRASPAAGAGRARSGSGSGTTTATTSGSSSGSPSRAGAAGEDAEAAAAGRTGSGAGAGGRALKWLAPPAKSVSRSPSGTPRSRGHPQQQQGQPSTTFAGAPLSPVATYASRFQDLPAEQRQQRLRSALEPVPIPSGSPTGSPCSTPRAAHAQLQQEQQQEEEDREAEEEAERRSSVSGGSSPRDGDVAAKSPTRRGSSAERGFGSPPLSPLRALSGSSPASTSRSPRGHTSSPNNSSGRGSPPLTPRAMAAHQLMQRRRSSRSSTAPHLASVEGGGGGGPRSTSPADGAGAYEGRDAMPPAETLVSQRRRDEKSPPLQQPAGAVTEVVATPSAAAASRAVAVVAVPSVAVGAAPDVGDVRVGRPRGLVVPQLHDAYDAAVRQLFTVYSYFATRKVSTAVAPAGGALQSDRAVRGVRRVEQHVMSYAAFSRLVTLLGYADFLAEVAAGGQAPPPPPHAAGSPSVCRLSQVQQRRKEGRAAPPPPPSAATNTAATHQRRRASVGPAVSAAAEPIVLPLSVADPRAIIAVLYACGVRQQGYHTVTQMDFQRFRRAMLLLHTWAHTARTQAAAAAKQQQQPQKRLHSIDAGGFAYLDLVPSLDALTAEEVVTAYTAVYERSMCAIPALALSADEPRANAGATEESEGAPGVDGEKKAQVAATLVGGRSGAATLSHAEEDRQAGVLTPPVSPIAAAAPAYADVSSLEMDDSTAALTVAAEAASTPREAARCFPAPSLAPRETLALDDLLRLLQRNDATLRQLFDAYSAPVTVYRSARYEAPQSAAAAAAVSNPCSLLLAGSPETSLVRGGPLDGARALAAAAVAAAAARQARRASAAPPAAASAPASPPSVLKSRAPASTAVDAIPAQQQDMWWKVQQLYTMSALESKEVYERTSHVLRVMPYKLFADLWRTLDVFPALMRAAALQQAFLDALTTPLLRGMSAPLSATQAQQRAAAAAAASAAVTAQPSTIDRPLVEALCVHGGLPYGCFVEAFVRVALTVFSHEVDRAAYPTATAKAAGLMQWCNKQVSLGLVAQRVQEQQVASAAVGHRSHGASRRASAAEPLASSGSPASPMAPSRVAKASGIFPDQMRLFRVPATGM